MTDIVVGSGHAGAFAALALIERGRSVLMLDAGEQLEPERDRLRARLASLPPERWSADDLEEYRTGGADAPKGAIRPYGSEFLFRDRDSPGDPWPAWFGLRPSYARGGLSNGWGASLLPYRQADLAAWPITADELAPHYRAVAERLPVAAAEDDLAALFPAFRPTGRRPLPASPQARALAARFERAGPRLARLGATVGGSWQAISSACSLCGLCLHGCPWRLIFNASALVEELSRHPRFTYRPGARVSRFEEDSRGVTVRFAGGEARGDRLFVAAGVLPTTRLVLSSLGRGGTTVTLLDSQHFFLPMLHPWSVGADVTRAPRHALAELFVELVDPELGPTTVHAQLYTYNDAYAGDMRRRFGFLTAAAAPLFAALSRRLIVAQTFLHSDHSPRVSMRLESTPEGERLRLERLEAPAGQEALRAARTRLAKVARLAGLLPLTALSRPGAVGSSFHCGGVFPMRADPSGLETDRLGRPGGLQRTHLVDASTFPSIPATTIAFSAMANAHRIASEAAALPSGEA